MCNYIIYYNIYIIYIYTRGLHILKLILLKNMVLQCIYKRDTE